MANHTSSSIRNKTIVLLTTFLFMCTNNATAQHSPSAKAVGAALKHQAIIAKLTRYEVKPEYLEQFREALRAYAAQAFADKNNIMAEAYAEQEHLSVMWIIERWNSRNNFSAFGKTRSFKAIAALSKHALLQPAQAFYVKDLEPVSKRQWRVAAAKTDKPLTIMLFVDAKPGTERDFQVVYHRAMPQFRSEPGVINYQLSQLEDNSTQFVTYEQFRSEDAFQYHLQFPPIQPVIDYLNTSIKKQPFQTGLHRLVPIPSGKP